MAPMVDSVPPNIPSNYKNLGTTIFVAAERCHRFKSVPRKRCRMYIKVRGWASFFLVLCRKRTVNRTHLCWLWAKWKSQLALEFLRRMISH